MIHLTDRLKIAVAPDPTVAIDPLSSSKWNDPMPIEASWGPSAEYLAANAAWANDMDLGAWSMP